MGIGDRGQGTGDHEDRLSGTQPPEGQPVTSVVVVAESAVRRQSSRDEDVEAVFMAWKEAGQLNGRTVLTADRRRKILARLREYPLVDVIDAARGIWESEWHREHGQTDLSLALRDAAHLERFRDVRRGLRPRGDPEPMGVQAKAMKRALEDGTVDTELLRWAYSPEGIAAAHGGHRVAG